VVGTVTLGQIVRMVCAPSASVARGQEKDCVIPIGDRAIAWIQKYLREARPTLA